MKTIYTDKTGFLPWAFLAVGVGWAALGIWDGWQEFGWRDAIRVLVGFVFLGFAARRFLQIHRAKAEGRDHTIVRIKNASDR
ncbi:hypothetical protein [Alteriqipengyuania sp.]|uniref:hypothetical protein n=1 Tax=Alteriqipengyuania sp. TaxID=2800692 RepID=UPI0035137B84